MHSPIIIQRANIRGKRQNKRFQEDTVTEAAVALSDSSENVPLQPLDPPPATEPEAPHRPRRRKPYGLAIAAAMLVFTPFLYALGITASMLISTVEARWDIVIGLTLLGSVYSNIGSILLYLAARVVNYIRKPVALVSLELLVLQIGTFMICREDIADLLDMEHPILTIVLVSLTLLCMIVLCVFSVLMLIHLLPKRPAKSAKV